MGRYSIGLRTTNGADASAALEIFTGAVDISAYAPRRRIVEIGITLAQATPSTFGIGRPAAIGVTPTSPVTLLSKDAGRPESTVQAALAWGTPPTAPASFYCRSAFGGAIGDTAIFSFPQGLTLGAADSIVIWNIGATALADVRVLIEE